jgi:hypothetical protein
MNSSELAIWQRVHRERKLLGVFLGLTVFAASAIPTNVRAVFLDDGHRLPAKAFVARTTPGRVSPSVIGPASPDLSTGEGVAPATGLPFAALPGNPLAENTPPAVPLIDELFPNLVSETGANPLAVTGINQPAPGRLAAAPNFVPITGGVAGSLPSGSTTPAEPEPPTDPVSAVPEPGSWVMLLLGFFLIGGTLRRKSERTLREPMAAFNRSAVRRPTK